MTKITVIGVGNLGAQIAYDIAVRSLADELVLMDIFKDLVEGQALDIQQALPFKNKTKIIFGSDDYSLIKNSEVIVLTAGKPRTPDMKDRLELAEINVKIVTSIIAEIKKFSPNSIIITITNPMDIINRFIYLSGFTREHVIGSGGQLDSARLRTILGCPEKEVEAFVIGEHGSDQIPVFSRMKIDGQVVFFSPDEEEKIKEELRQSAIKVIEKKKATIFAPASNTVDMVEAIVKDKKELLVCSVNLAGEFGLYDVSIGVPCILGKKGVEKVVEWELDQEERAELKKTAEKLKDFYSQLK